MFCSNCPRQQPLACEESKLALRARFNNHRERPSILALVYQGSSGSIKFRKSENTWSSRTIGAPSSKGLGQAREQVLRMGLNRA
mmetsp:Transcript_3059/g.4385  ORF Transcript_3059/g.4385 Transcript_3059/m.4385 type:complete len:84 (-) Transcript_3059:759-1010(-)